MVAREMIENPHLPTENMLTTTNSANYGNSNCELSGKSFKKNYVEIKSFSSLGNKEKSIF